MSQYGLALAPRQILEQLHAAMDKRFTGAKISMPDGAKVVMIHDPFSPDLDHVSIDCADCKGKPKAGERPIAWKNIRVVSTSSEYLRIGICRSHQVGTLMKNFKEITPIQEQIDTINGVVKFDLDSMRKGMRLINRLEERNEEIRRLTRTNHTVKSSDCEFIHEARQRAERLLLAGVDPKTHPTLQDLAFKMAHWLADSLEKGVPVVGLRAMLAITPACPMGCIILAKKWWKALGKPSHVWVYRYPVNQPSEVVKMEVVLAGNAEEQYPSIRHIPFISGGHLDMLFINQEDLPMFNADCDGDLMNIEPADGPHAANFEMIDEEPAAMPKGKGRAATHPFEEACKGRDASQLVGRVCNLMTLIRATLQCRKMNKTTKALLVGFLALFKVLYHKVIQATKNMDANPQTDIRRLESFLREFGLTTERPRAEHPSTGVPWGHPRYERTAAGWKARVMWYRGMEKKWANCLHGWTAIQMGQLRWFLWNEPKASNKSMLTLAADKVVREYTRQTPEDLLSGQTAAQDLQMCFQADMDSNAVTQENSDLARVLEGKDPIKLSPKFTQTKEMHRRILGLDPDVPITIGAREACGAYLLADWIHSETKGSWHVDTILTIDQLAKLYNGKPMKEYHENRLLFHSVTSE